MNTQVKKIGLLCLLLVAGGGWIVFASRQSGPVEEAPPAASEKSEVPALQTSNFKLQTADRSSLLSDPNLVSSAGAGLGNGELFLKMMLSVVLVIALGAAALYVSKKVLPRVAGAPGKEIHVLETAYLGPRKALHLVEVGNQRLLIASTNDNVTMLAHVNEAWLDLSRQELGEAVKT
jgi:flagellar biosynthetic protein FliO